MTWFGWVVVAWWASSALLIIGGIGKPRPPISPATAVVSVLLVTILCVGLFTVGTGNGL